jgi:hypothetical protein
LDGRQPEADKLPAPWGELDWGELRLILRRLDWRPMRHERQGNRRDGKDLHPPRDGED